MFMQARAKASGAVCLYIFLTSVTCTLSRTCPHTWWKSTSSENDSLLHPPYERLLLWQAICNVLYMCHNTAQSVTYPLPGTHACLHWQLTWMSKQTRSISWLFADQLIVERLLVISNVVQQIRWPYSAGCVFQEGKMSAPPIPYSWVCYPCNWCTKLGSSGSKVL